MKRNRANTLIAESKWYSHVNNKAFSWHNQQNKAKKRPFEWQVIKQAPYSLESAPFILLNH